MNYEESVHALLTLGRELGAPRQPALSEASGARVQKFGLENITTLAAGLGNPQRAVPCVHIAGTNGKGSTAAMLESILGAAGLRTALYTSPHLERINERIRFNGEPIADEEFAAAWTQVRSAIESLMASGKLAAHPTFFECVTAIGFQAIATHGVDFAVHEVGLGGRLDATNIVEPEVAVITSIDFDHENFLGHSIEEIAGEKAGIIKPAAWVVSSAERAEARAVIARRCAETGARLFEVDDAWRIEDVQAADGCYSAVVCAAYTSRNMVIAPALPGRFQIRNALAAATAAQLLGKRGFRMDDDAIAAGIASVRWPGRLERLAEHPAVYLDGAHNPGAARELAKFWDENFRGRRIILVYGAMRDKAVDENAGLLFPRAECVILTEPRQTRAVSAAILAEMTGHFGSHISVVRDPGEALESALALAGPNDAIFVTGSLYLVGALRSYWHTRAGAEIPSEHDMTGRLPRH
jgi:dihydrofolate synthase / folylpolyglutamate synthase